MITLSAPEQRTIAEPAQQDENDPELAQQAYVPKLAPVVALRAKDYNAGDAGIMPILMADPQCLDDVKPSARAYFNENYGFEVSVPAVLFSEDVIQPAELYRI